MTAVDRRGALERERLLLGLQACPPVLDDPGGRNEDEPRKVDGAARR